MNFGQAIASGFSNYVNFSDRACRSAYWYWFLFVVLGQIVTMIIDSVIGLGLMTGIFSLVVLLPGIAVSVRRCTIWIAAAGGCCWASSRWSAPSY